MNLRLIGFSGLTTAGVGVGVGLVLGTLFPTPYQGGFYENMNRKYRAIDGISGLTIGISQEAFRQLKNQRAEEEREAMQRTEWKHPGKRDDGMME